MMMITIIDLDTVLWLSFEVYRAPVVGLCLTRLPLLLYRSW